MTRSATCLQFGDKSPPNLKRPPQGGSEGSPKGSRKAERREAERTPQGGIEGWERTPQGERDRSGPEAPYVDGPWCVSAASLESSGPVRAGVVRHDHRLLPAGHRGRGPEEHGRLRPNGYSGLRRVRAPFFHPIPHVGITAVTPPPHAPAHNGATRPISCAGGAPGAGRSVQRGPEPGRPFACRDLAVQLGLHEGEVVGMGDADTAALGRKHGEGARPEGLGDHLGE